MWSFWASSHSFRSQFEHHFLWGAFSDFQGTGLSVTIPAHLIAIVCSVMSYVRHEWRQSGSDIALSLVSTRSLRKQVLNYKTTTSVKLINVHIEKYLSPQTCHEYSEGLEFVHKFISQ